MNIFFNSRIYTNQSFVNALFENNKRLQEVKMQVAAVQEILLTISAIRKGKTCKKIRKEEYIIQMLTKVLI